MKKGQHVPRTPQISQALGQELHIHFLTQSSKTPLEGSITNQIFQIISLRKVNQLDKGHKARQRTDL